MRTGAELLLLHVYGLYKTTVGLSPNSSDAENRGLIISDDNYALGRLKILSHFRLANYPRPMEQEKTTHAFKPNSRFDNAVNLYFFDKKPGALLFTAIRSFETALRSKLTHHFSMAYGASRITDRRLFVDMKIFTDCSVRAQQEVFRSKEDFVQGHFGKRCNPTIPSVRKTLEVVSFGTLSKIGFALVEKFPPIVLSWPLSVGPSRLD